MSELGFNGYDQQDMALKGPLQPYKKCKENYF